MGLNVAIQMDPPGSLNYHKDTTYLLGLEAIKRGHALSYYNVDTLALREGKVTATCHPLAFRREEGNEFTLGDGKTTELKNFDLILMRQDFNSPIAYSSYTHILDHLKNDVLILNDPAGVRESPEKMLITHFPDLAPPTLLSRNLDQIKEFQKQYEDIIVKPLNGFGGLDVYHAKPGDDNITSVFDMMTRLHPGPLVVQKYLPEIKDGDKRIIVIEGEPVGAFSRIAAKGNARANLASGGSAVKAEVTQRDKEICARIKPELVKRGLVLVGLDVIGGFVTEINPKSPTGCHQVNDFNNIKCEEIAWDAYEKRLGRNKRL